MNRFPHLARLSTVSALVSLLVCASGAVAGENLPAPKANARIVAIGDVHGSHYGLVQVLRSAELIDEENRWSGGDAILVQTGDLTDRGADVKGVFDLLRRLQKEAPRHGGRVVTLMGNHEFYNLVGIVSTESTDPPVLADLVGKFGGRRAEKRQRDLLEQYRAWRERYPGCGSVTDEEWLTAHPAGFEEYLDAIGPEGEYGRWLRTFPVVVEIGDTIFVHGGLSPDLEEMGFSTLEEINQRVADELALYERGREWAIANGVSVPGLQVKESLCAVDSELFRRTGNGETADQPGIGGSAAAAAAEDPVVEVLRFVRRSLPSSGWLANHQNGPLWFRGYAFWTDEEGREAMPTLEERYGVGHFVVGHTPQPGKIETRFDGSVFLIDTALVFGKGGAALEIQDGVFTAIYPDRREVLWPVEEAADAAAVTPGTEDGEPREAHAPGLMPAPVEVPAEDALPGDGDARGWVDAAGRPLPFASFEEIEEFLLTASVVADEPIPIGITKPRRLELERDGVRAHAAFRHYHEETPRKKLKTSTVLLFRDSFENEVIAYELSQMLGIGRIPPTVERAVDHRDGSVQIWVEGATMEKDRRQRGVEAPDPLRFNRQFYDMHVFDNLIGNFDRNQGNILVDGDWDVWLIDHSRAFRQVGSLPSPDSVVRCSKPLWRGMGRLTREALEERIGGLLSPAEIESLLERRDRVVEILGERIESLGQEKVLFDWDDPSPDIQVFEAPEVPRGDEDADPDEAASL